MIFENKIKETNFKPTNRTKTKVRLDLEPKRENKLQIMNTVFSKEVFNNSKRIGRSKLIKMAIDNLTKDLKEMDSEEKQLLYLRELYKEAEF